MKYLILILFIYTPVSNAYLQKRGNRGAGLFWLPRNISYALNTQGCSSNIVDELLGIASKSALEWTDNSWLALKVHSTGNGPRTLVNDIYCSSDLTYTQSSAVVGVTRIIYNEDSGQIIETDITLNSNIEFATNTESAYFVGNVLTHEFGHSIGFDHSEAFRSTMFYSLFLGQSTISSDGKAGAYSLYPSGPIKGTIRGRVIGGTVENPVGIFGAFVQAYSTQTGELMASVVTLDDGTFEIKGLTRGVQYYLYVKPLELLSTISKYYSSARNDFCGPNSARVSYRGTFFSTCDTTPGYPQGVDLSSSVVDVGSISAYCELREIKLDQEDETPTTTTTFRGLELFGNRSDYDFGSTLVSYFTPNELSANELSTNDLSANEDASNTIFQEFEIDLTYFNVTSENIYLDIKLNSQNFYSQLQLKMEVIQNYLDEGNQITYEFSSDENGNINVNKDGSPELNLIGRVPLDATDTSFNNFKVKISAVNVDFSKYPDFSENDFFPGNTNFEDPIGFYLGIVTISEKVDGSFETILQKDYGGIRDNLSCPGAHKTLKISAIVDQKPEEKDGGIFSCNSIEPTDGSGNGPLNMAMGFVLVLLVSRVGRDNLKRRKTHGGD